MRLKDRTAVVIGAGSGIGRAIARSLAQRGCHLALADISEAGLTESIDLVKGATPAYTGPDFISKIAALYVYLDPAPT